MAFYTLRQLVDRARVYIADDHDDTPGFISDDAWLAIASAVYADEYRDMVRLGIISPAPTDTTFTSYTTTVDGVLATVGVAEDLGNGNIRLLTPYQSENGRAFWGHSDGTPVTWTAHGVGDEITYTLEPRVTGNYIVRTIAIPDVLAGMTNEVELPYGCDEHFVLALARKAKLKDGSASALLEKLYLEAEARRNMSHFGRLNTDSPRVRRTQPQFRWSTDPRAWRYH